MSGVHCGVVGHWFIGSWSGVLEYIPGVVRVGVRVHPTGVHRGHYRGVGRPVGRVGGEQGLLVGRGGGGSGRDESPQLGVIGVAVVEQAGEVCHVLVRGGDGGV